LILPSARDCPAGRAASGHGGGNGGGNRRGAVIGGTVAVIVLAVIGYLVLKPSSGKSAGLTAEPTASQGPTNQPTAAKPTATGAAATPTGGASPSTAATSAAPTTSSVAVDIARVHVAVYNGSNVNQRASAVKAALVNEGFAQASVGGTVPTTATTKIFYPSNRADSAAAVAKALKMPAANVALSTTYTQVAVVIGTDWKTGDTYPAA
jgi:hypothetical protein